MELDPQQVTADGYLEFLSQFPQASAGHSPQALADILANTCADIKAGESSELVQHRITARFTAADGTHIPSPEETAQIEAALRSGVCAP